MSRTEVSRTVDAPVEAVFDAIAHAENFARIQPAIMKLEFLTEQRTGAGTRFKETRMMGNKAATCELEVTEYVPHERVRIVSDEGGTVWDTVFTTTPAPGGGTELSMVMDAKAYKLAAKIMNPLIKGMIRKHIEADLDAVKVHCEAQSV